MGTNAQRTTSATLSTRQHGQLAEDAACLYLAQQGLKLVARNFVSKMGELDLIMRQNDTLVFVEVRSRKNNHYGHIAATVTTHKQKKLIKTAQLFLQKYQLIDKIPCRFDVIAITQNPQNPAIEWIKNAFEVY